MVTVAELILRLQAFHPDCRVVVSGYEGGYDDIAQPALLRIAVNAVPDVPYWGRHESAPDKSGEREEDAVLIGADKPQTL